MADKDRFPWDNEPYIDPVKATERAIRAAQPRRVDPKNAAVKAWADTAFNDEIKKLRSTSEGRNDQLFKSSANLFEIVAAGALSEYDVIAALRDACDFNGLARDDGEHTVTATIKSGRRHGYDSPRDLSQVGKNKGLNGFHIEDAPVQTVSYESIFDLERGFWTERDSLKAIYIGALARMCAPWAVLGYCAARALTMVRPHCTLPALIGGPGSLNWFCAITAKSGGGKSSSAAVARELVDFPVIPRNLGSGEGIVDAYVKPANKETGEPKGLHESIMFTADEIDTVKALKDRQGSTLMGTIRQAFTSEKLGTSNRTASSLHLDAHSYRMTLALNVQPARAGTLMDDQHGGTLQRIMWFPGTDARIDAQVPDMPGALLLPSPSKWLYPRDLRIPYEAIELIRDERARAMRGEQNALDGHALFIREKFAYALAVLDGRDEMTLDDWRLAGTASRVSDRTREWVMYELEQAEEDEAAKRGALAGVSQHAADERKTDMVARRKSRIAKWVLSKLESGPLTNRQLTQAISSRDRPWLQTVLESLEQDGLTVHDVAKGWSKVNV